MPGQAAPEVKKIEARPEVRKASFHMCQFGLKSASGKAMKKHTSFLTNSWEVYQALSGRFCNGDHEHQQIQGSEDGKKPSVSAQVYPELFVQTVCAAILRQVQT